MKTAAIILGAVLCAASARAELITVDNITNYSTAATPAGTVAIAGDADVSTHGVLLEAVNFGGATGGLTWVNGVPFKSLAAGADGVIHGVFIGVQGANQVPVAGLGSAAAPFASLSPAYQALLREGTRRDTGYINYLTFTNLIPGEKYEIQLWLNDSSYSGTYAASTFSLKEGEGNGLRYLQNGSYLTNTGDIKLSKNNAGVPGGLGSYFLGSFTATGSLPNGGGVSINLEPGSLINAAQIRRIPAGEVSALVTHPRLLVTRGRYDALRAKVGTAPFSTIYSHNEGSPLEPNWNRKLSPGAWGIQAQSLSCATLGYVLDTAAVHGTPAQYRQAILDQIASFHDHDLAMLDTTSWSTTVPLGNPLLNMILALDVIHDDLTAAELSQAENSLSEAIEWYRHVNQNWGQNKYGLISSWELYKGNNPTAITSAVNSYVSVWLDDDMKPDGSYDQAASYLSARTGSGRNAKHWPMDILQFTGQYPWYSEPRMQGLMTFLSSFMYTPCGSVQLFGDSVLSGVQDASQQTIFSKMGLYSSQAASRGKWLLNGGSHPATLVSDYGSAFMLYATLPDDDAGIVAKMPASALMTDYGAALWDRTDSRNALMGTLVSRSDSGAALGANRGHNHYDTNSLHLVGYGQHLLFNSGASYQPSYPGWAPDGSQWDRAWLQNSVLIGSSMDHVNYEGGGLTDGLTGGSMEFGRTTSGRAIAAGQHGRSLLFIQPVAGKSNGYFVLLDEVRPDNPADPIRINLHPNTLTGLSAVTANQEYLAPINAYHFGSGGSEQVTVFYGTAPVAVNTPVGYHGDDSASVKSLALNYLEAVYAAGSDGWLRTATVVFPADATHAKAAMTRTSGTGYAGVSVAHGGGVNDVIVQSAGGSLLTTGPVSWQGKALSYRSDNGVINSYLVINGQAFNNGAASRSGFAADSAVSVRVDAAEGGIECKNRTVVTFYAPGRLGVKIDGVAQPVTLLGDGGLQVVVAAGRRALTLTSLDLYATISWDTDPAGGVLGGAGNWNTSTANWTADAGASNSMWDNGSLGGAVFSGVGGTVTIGQAPTGVVVNGVKFTATGYTIAGTGGAGTLALAGVNAGFNVVTGTATISAPVAAAAGFVESGTGTLVLSNTGNALAGPIDLNAGTLWAQNATAQATNTAFTVLGAAVVNLNQGATLRVSQNATGGYGRNFTVASAITVTGTATLDMRPVTTTGNSGSKYTFGSLTLNPGSVLNIADSLNWGSRLGAVTTTLAGSATLRDQAGTNGGKLEVTAVTVGNSVAPNSITTLTVDGGSTGGILSGAISNNPSDATKVLALTKSGTGTLTLSGSNTFTGLTLLDNGSLVLIHANALQKSTLDHRASGTLGFGSASATYTLGGLTGTRDIALTNNAATPAAIALKVGNNNSSTTYAGILSGSGSLVHVGTGTLILSGANTYSGGTTVSAGTLWVNGTTGSGNVAVAAGAGLGGSGTLAGTTAYAAGSNLPWVITDWAAGPVLTSGPAALIGTASAPVKILISQSSLSGFTERTRTFPILAATSLAVANVVVDASGFTAGGGTWAVQQSGNTLDLVYTAKALPAAYLAWATQAGLTADNNAPTDDPDGDGKTNLYEFAFDGNPLGTSAMGKVYPMPNTQGGVVLTVAVRKSAPVFTGSPALSATTDGVNYRIEASLDLAGFVSPVVGVAPLTTGLPAPGPDYEYRSFSLDVSAGRPARGFLRASATCPWP